MNDIHSAAITREIIISNPDGQVIPPVAIKIASTYRAAKIIIYFPIA